MSEPLTKDKLVDHIDFVDEVILIEDLKSALEEFEKLISEEASYEVRANGTKISLLLRKAFPAIYIMEMTKMVEWITENWDKIPNEYKTDIKPDRSVQTLNDVVREGHIVVLLLDRQKPSIEPDYSFDEERIGVNKFGQIIWGFDSGCSCPISWEDSYPACYSYSNTWKEFEINLKDFDKLWDQEMQNKFEEIKSSVVKK